LYKSLKLLFTGDHVAKSEESNNLNLFWIYSKQSGMEMTIPLQQYNRGQLLMPRRRHYYL